MAMFDEASKLQQQISKMKTRMPVASSVKRYREDCVKVEVDILRNGYAVLSIEYFGNAEFSWVKKNLLMNIKSVITA